MKPKSILKWLGLVSASVALSAASVSADPEKADDAKNGKNKKEQADKGQPADHKANNPKPDMAVHKDKSNQPEHKVEQKPEHKTEHKVEQKADNRADNRTDNRTDNRADNRADNRSDNKADQRADHQAEHKAFKRGEFKGRLEDRDRDRITGYFSGFRGREHGLPPGMVWQGGRRLPSGWQQRLVIGYVIGDDWWDAFRPVPYDWFPGIAVVPDTRLYWYGNHIVRVYEPTREVVDVIVIPTIQVDL